MIFGNSAEYEARLRKPFVPPEVTLKQIHEAVPKHLLRRDPIKSSFYVARDVFFCVLFFCFGASIEKILESNFGGYIPLTAAWQTHAARTALWLTYWWWQGISFASFFCIAHELGHGTMYDSRIVNDVLGFTLDTFIMAPFFAWKASHNAHHKAVASMERDENYVPHLRSHYDLPPEERATTADYSEVFEETPFYELARILLMQSVGWWYYLADNALGSKMYPPHTNHFSPYSPLFKPEQRRGIILSDIGLSVMASILYYLTSIYGFKAFVGYYLIPLVLCNHWIVMSTYLHHSDPTIPHYRKEEWSFLRGAAATVDRPLMGWVGRFFFHNVAHDHVAHHFFSFVPFYNQPEITKAIRTVLKDNYNYDSTNTFYALYRSFTECVFVEEEGSIIFYKNKHGQAQREIGEGAFQQKNWNPEEQDKLAEQTAEAKKID